MKAKFAFLIVAGLFLAFASQAQLPGKYSDSRDRHEMAYNGNTASRELNRGNREFRREQKQMKQPKRHHRHHHRHHGRRPHRHA
jgi:hypothetical protein